MSSDDSDWKFDPTSKESLEKYSDFLEEKRLVALGRPLTENDTLVCHGPSLFQSCASLSQCTTHKRSPVVPLLSNDSPSNTTNSLRLRLGEGIQSGTFNLSQVWRCKAECLGNSILHPSPDVVVKLYQESLAIIPCWSWGELSPDSYHPIEWTIRREANAYAYLRNLQGSTIPYSYGFYKFVLPCGEEVIGHVMEYIPGCSLRAYAEKFPDDPEKLLNAYFSALNSFHVIRQNGVLQHDVQLRNIMLPPGSPPADAIIVDLGSARIPAEDSRSPEEMARDIRLLSQACLEFSEFGRTVRVWCYTHPNDPRLEGTDYEISRIECERIGLSWRDLEYTRNP